MIGSGDFYPHVSFSQRVDGSRKPCIVMVPWVDKSRDSPSSTIARVLGQAHLADDSHVETLSPAVDRGIDRIL